MRISESYLDQLIQWQERISEALVAMAEDPETSVGVLRKLAKVADPHVEAAVSLNPRTPSKILEGMLRKHPGVDGEEEEHRIHIVWNSALRLKVLKERIEKDPSPHVREAALASWATRLARSSDASPNELWQAFQLLENRQTVSGGKRQRAAKRSLLQHPRFPKNKVS